jgi:hypothetical protein
VSGGALGRRPNFDPRSLRFRVGQPARAVMSVEHQRRSPILDQGALGSCTGNAAAGALGTDPLYNTLPAGHPPLDEDFAVRVYSAATKIDPWPGDYPPDDTGSDGLSAAKACKALGLIPGYLHATSLDGMQAALQDTPVIVGVSWYEAFDEPDGDGHVHVGGDVRGGHEFEVVGMDVDLRLFHAINSWGTGWGRGGHFWFGWDDMDRLLHEDGDCTQLLPLTAPTPTPTPPDAADRALDAALKPWAKTICHGTPDAGKAVTGFEQWRRMKGLDGL